MLNINDVIDAYPLHLQKFRRSLLREYLQYKILDITFSDPKWARRLCIIGGTCLRIAHNNRRFSEDLDFDNFDLTESEFSEIAAWIKTKLEEEGYVVEIRNVFKGAYRCYIRFPNLLYKLGLSGYQDEKIMIQFDTQAQQFDFEPQSYIMQKFDVFSEIFIVPTDLLLAQKCLTILNRKRKKGRDFFDVTFLLEKTQPDYKYLDVKAGISTPKQLKEHLLEVCNEISLKDMANDVRPFLF